MELSTVTVHSMNYSGNISTIDVDNKTTDDIDASAFYSNQSFNNGTVVYPFNPPFLEVRRLLFVVSLPILIVFGTYGNAVSFYIVRRGSLKEVSTCFYMAMLAIADTRKYICGATETPPLMMLDLVEPLTVASTEAHNEGCQGAH